MTLALGKITVDTREPMPLATWWAEQLGGRIVEENGGFFVEVAFAEGAPRMAFQRVDDPTPAKNRIHLDLTSEDLDSEVARLLNAGATKIADREMPGFAWVTLADPDGNEFCVAQRPGASISDS
ncbi:VOC family protein [Gordonia sp. 'Campus']|uniref:VOC family protein n=1 Tax=Gordonia sp. 'Campus' TaxID=2915824 RepID=UPI001EE4AC24|nr:VOC family protein [Gordonia sp. 'Campus']